MAKLISGIDFSKLAEFRTQVQVKISADRFVDLPLITLRDTPRAEMFLNRADAIRAAFAILHARAKDRATASSELKNKLDKNPELSQTLTGEETFNRFDETVTAIADSQRRMDAIFVRADALADEILDFLTPYLKDTGVIEQLRQVEAVETTRTLQAMLYGEAAFATETDKEVGEDSKANPTA